MIKVILEVDNLEDTKILFERAQARFNNEANGDESVRRFDSLIGQINKKMMHAKDGTDRRDPILLDIADEIERRGRGMKDGYDNEAMTETAKAIRKIIHNWA